MPPLIASGSDYSVELRVRFPAAANEDLTPTELSGALWTVSSGSDFVASWYEKPSATSTTGNIYVTGSFGRLTMASASIFNDHFYNLTFVRDHSSSSFKIYAMRHESDEVLFSSSSLLVASGAEIAFTNIDLGSFSLVPSRGQFWAQEFRLWADALTGDEIAAHSNHFESYGRAASHDNDALMVHWRLNDGTSANGSGVVSIIDSTPNAVMGTGSNFTPNVSPFTKFLETYAYIPSIDYGWNQEKVRVFDGSRIDPFEAYHDERFVTLEFNMYDALNEDISHLMTSYEELNTVIGLPVNRYREDYEGLWQMRETYFKRLQGPLNFRVFVDMLDFFDSSFSSVVERLLPARTSFKGDELIVESHMLERPKYQYQLRPVVEGRIDISGSIAIVDRGDDFE